MIENIEAIQNHPLHVSIGVQKITSDSGNARLTAVVNTASLNPQGFYHGGVMYLLLDACAYSGVLSALESNEDAVTHDIHVSVLRPAKLNDQIIYESTLVKRGRSLCFIDAQARCGEKLIATARITKSIISS